MSAISAVAAPGMLVPQSLKRGGLLVTDAIKNNPLKKWDLLSLTTRAASSHEASDQEIRRA